MQGEHIFHLDSNLNSYYDQDHFSKFYAHLQNKGINFVTPYFEEQEERDDYNNWSTTQKRIRDFQVIVPGVEALGDGYYVIPDDKIDLFEEVIDMMTEILPPGQQFTSIIEKSKNLVKGKIQIDGYKYDAYMSEDGQIVINRPYKK